MPRSAMQGLDIPLLPSPLARRFLWCFLSAQALYGAELAWMGCWPAAAGVLAAGAAWYRAVRRHRIEDPRALRRLLLTGDGRMHGITVAGDAVALRLHPSSLYLGRWLLLCMWAGKSRHVFLLGPDNVESSQLAALRRRVGITSRSDFD